MKKEKAIKSLSISDLSDKGREKIAQKINPLAANAFALYVKTKNFHWHVSGPHFRDYHLLLDEQAEQIFAMIDVLAERVRKLGKTTIRSIGHISNLQSIKDEDTELLEAKKMLEHLMKDNKDFLLEMRSAHKTCEEQNDLATCSILEVFMDETEKRIWFLFETIKEIK